jgi:hypothetical protein
MVGAGEELVSLVPPSRSAVAAGLHAVVGASRRAAARGTPVTADSTGPSSSRAHAAGPHRSNGHVVVSPTQAPKRERWLPLSIRSVLSGKGYQPTPADRGYEPSNSDGSWRGERDLVTCLARWACPRLAGPAHGAAGSADLERSCITAGELLCPSFWFQSFGAVMGMDWHSSGITTSVLGAQT